MPAMDVRDYLGDCDCCQVPILETDEYEKSDGVLAHRDAASCLLALGKEVKTLRDRTTALEAENRHLVDQVEPWGLWNGSSVQKCWVSDDDGHFGSRAPKRFPSREAAEAYGAQFGSHLEARRIKETR